MHIERPTDFAVPPLQPADAIPERYRDQLELFVTANPESQEWDAAAELEAEVFKEKGYVNSREELTEEHAPYLDTTVMMGLRFRRNGAMIGASRLADPHPVNGLKVLSDLNSGRLQLSDAGAKALRGISLAKTMDIDTLSVHENWRGARGIGFVAILYAAQYLRAHNNGQPHILASFDAGYYRGFSRKYDGLCTQLGPAVDYMGSLTVPALIDVDKASPELFTGKMA